MEKFEGVVNIEQALDAKLKNANRELNRLIDELENVGVSEGEMERGEPDEVHAKDKKFAAILECYVKVKKEVERMMATRKKIEEMRKK